jgi:arylsulfatase A-like enzyme
MAATHKPLNILLILTDQHRYDALGCYGAPTCRTPNIDSLAARGVRFDTAYTPCTPCSPARASLFTGLYPHKHRVTGNNSVLDPALPNLASELRGAGYNLGYAGKWHVDEATLPTDHGFVGKDFPGYGYPAGAGFIKGMRWAQGQKQVLPHYPAYLKEHGYEPPEVLEAFYGDNPGKQNQEIYALQSGNIETNFEYMVSEDTIDLLRQMQDARVRTGQPFFMWTNFWGPHTPCLLPEPYYSMYDPSAIPEEPSFGETWEKKPRVHELHERMWGLSSGGWASWREIVARYWGYVTMIDDLVGRILDELDRLGLAEDTLVVFSADHGDMMGAHRLNEKGPYAYEQCFRVPMLAAHPACRAPGSACSEFVYLHDLFPTLLDVAGRPLPDAPDSRSVLDYMLNADVPPRRRSVYTMYDRMAFHFELRMVRTKTHKLVYNHVDIGELYDLVSDPWELHNLIDVPEAKPAKDELLGLMREHMLRLNDPMLRLFDMIRHVY